jgi:hypothetical protein
MRERADRAQVVITRGGGKHFGCRFCQNRQPAGTRPVQFLIPAGSLSVKQIAIGGKESLIAAVNF